MGQGWQTANQACHSTGLPVVSSIPCSAKGLGLCKLHFPGSSASLGQWEALVGEQLERKRGATFWLLGEGSSFQQPPAASRLLPPLLLPARLPSVVPVAAGLCALGC